MTATLSTPDGFRLRGELHRERGSGAREPRSSAPGGTNAQGRVSLGRQFEALPRRTTFARSPVANLAHLAISRRRFLKRTLFT